MGSGDKICGVVDWGLEPYGRVLGWQRELVAARKAGRVPDLLLVGEHTPVITLGRNARREHIRLPEAELARRGVELHETDRGGDVTYHGPGQLVGYPILDLTGLSKDLVWYVRALEEALIRAAGEFGVEATRKTSAKEKRQLYTGVWVSEEKLAAIGVHVSRWVTSHGFAFNVTTDLSHFDLIVPCGIGDKGVTSLEKLGANRSTQRLQPLGPPSGGSHWVEQERALMTALKAAVVKYFGEVFGREMISLSREELEERVGAHEAAAS